MFYGNGPWKVEGKGIRLLIFLNFPYFSRGNSILPVFHFVFSAFTLQSFYPLKFTRMQTGCSTLSGTPCLCVSNVLCLTIVHGRLG